MVTTMSNQWSLSWAQALRDLQSDRQSHPPIREERLRSTAGLRGTPAVALSAWRGRSGRRYVVGVHDMTADVIADLGPAVAAAVTRNATGQASIVNVTALADAAWVAAARAAGATELHVHRLAETDAECAAVVRDLTEVILLA